MTVFAKPVLKNKFWIVENQGEKVATIQMVDDGSVVYVSSTERKKYASIKLLSKDYNIVFDKENKKSKDVKTEHELYGYPVNGKPWNSLYDIKHQFPIYTKTSKSKSYYCAGHYIIKFNNGWVKSFCPKFITLNRYEYQGPFKTKLEMQEQLRLANGK
jgi:hypothetical protein